MKLALLTLALLVLSVPALAQQPAQPLTKPPIPPAAETVIDEWNKLVQAIDEENVLLQELQQSYARFHPQKSIMTPETRASQRKRRVKIWTDIIISREEQMKVLKKIMEAEQRY